MTIASLQQRHFPLFHKFCSEVRPPDLVRRDERKRPMTCSFEEIAELEEENIQFPERTSPDRRSPFAVVSESPFVERRGPAPQKQSSPYARKAARRLCHAFSDPNLRKRQLPTFVFRSRSPGRNELESDLMTLPPIPEGDLSSEDDSEETQSE